MRKLHNSRVFAKVRPGALPIPANHDVCAFTKPNVFERWAGEAAGIRAVESGDSVITMFDVIGQDYWSGGGITAKSITAQLRAIGDRPVEVHVNSPGGDMFEGIAIYNVLREHPQEVTIKIMAMAASAASIIAMAGDRIEIGAASFMMIHNCWVLAMGNQFDLRETADWLAPFDQAMVDLYSQRSGQSADKVTKWMSANAGDGTYMSGSQAIERGFADALLSADSMKVDDAAKARDLDVNELRALELSLVHAGINRTDARARINKIKGTPGAALEATPGAGEDWSGLSGLLATISAT
ncbi:Clp protease ClpP [Agrobacterium rhizogenes]|nr:Clp protease ClpP [Rhizobium rhizogenes]NTH70074.1 Clp protease ClpP [Rhizobium rhizogenes]